MRRILTTTILIAVAAVLTAPPLHADVKIRERTLVKLEGFFLRLLTRGQPRDGITSTVAVKGDRKSSTTDAGGQIIDLAEGKVYELDIRRKEYRVKTFAELREELQKARAEAQKQAGDLEPEEREQIEQAGRQLAIDLDVTETGQTRQIAGYDAREVMLTATAHEQGRPVEESGGFVMTSTMWIGPSIAALEEVSAFDLRFYQAVYGDVLAGIDVQMAAALTAMFPSFQEMAGRLQAESEKLQGTPLLTVTTFETVKSAEQMQAASAPPGREGGIGGAIAGRLMRGRGQVQQRTTTFTTTTELLSIDTTVSEADVSIPEGFRERR